MTCPRRAAPQAESRRFESRGTARPSVHRSLRIPDASSGFLVCFALAAALFVSNAIALSGCARAEARHPNVVLILADDLGWSDVGYHGGEIPTPAIDGLVAGGLELDRFYVSPLCTATRAALLTGRSPMRFGMQLSVVRPWSREGLPAGERTLADAFRSAGYRTALVGKWHLGHAEPHHLPTQRGFDHFYGSLNGAIDYFTHTRAEAIDWQRNGATVREPGYTTDLVAAEAARLIEVRDPARSLFLLVAFHAVHGPPQAPAERLAQWSAKLPAERAVFAAMLSGLDDGVATILAALDREGIADRTLVVFASDNGAGASGGSNAPFRRGKGTTFEGGIRVPAALRWPGTLPSGARSEQRIRDADLFPTLLRAAGIEPGDGPTLDGVDLWPQLAGATEAPRGVFHFAAESASGSWGAAIDARYKLVTFRGDDSEHTETYLFDLDADPNETRDLAPDEPAVVRRLTQELERWKRLHPATGLRGAAEKPEGWNPPTDWNRQTRIRR